MKADDKLNILIVSWSFPPAADPRAAKTEAIVHELLRLGHSVSLLTRVKEGQHIDKNLQNRLKHIEVIPWKDWPLFKVVLSKSTNWLNINKYKRLFNGLLLKLFSYPGIQAYFEVKRWVKRFNELYDLCISVDGPQQMHWAIASARKRKHINCSTWIADCGDPLTRLGVGNMVAPYFKLVENWFCRQADYITVPVEQGFNYFLPKFRSKIHLVRHSLIFPPRSDNSTKLSNSTGVPTFCYAGNMMPYQYHARPFFAFLDSLDLNFEFHLYGPNDALLEEVNTKYKSLSKKLKNMGSLSRFELLNRLHKYNFLVYFPYSNNQAQVPFKLIDYDYSDRPILKYDSSLESNENFLSFLDGCYYRALKTKSFLEYSCENTIPEYLALCREKV